MDEGGRPGAFEDFYRQQFAVIARAVYMTLADPEEARDIAQEAFVRTWERWDHIGRREAPLFFTLRVARNLATSRLRQAIRHRRLVASIAPPPEMPPSLDGAIAIREALRKLPPRQRWAVVLCDLLDLTSVEAAPIVGVSASTLRVHLARARSRLREALAEGVPLVRAPERRR
jgi:RNA polymerase sigma-70 factor (ECF subfamily)